MDILQGKMTEKDQENDIQTKNKKYVLENVCNKKCVSSGGTGQP